MNDMPDSNAKLTAALNLPMNVVRIGSKVTVNVDGDKEIYEICEEGDPTKNKISYQSPIGEALLGHRRGQVVVAKVPMGDLYIKILKLDNEVRL